MASKKEIPGVKDERKLDNDAKNLVREMYIDGKVSGEIQAALAKAGYEPITRQGLWRYSQEDRVKEAIKQAEELARLTGMGRRSERIRRLTELIDGLETIIRERGEQLKGFAAGGASGLICETEKSIGAGDYAQMVKEHRVDVGLLKEYRELLKQISIEVGEWTEKKDITSDNQAINCATPLQLAQILKETAQQLKDGF